MWEEVSEEDGEECEEILESGFFKPVRDGGADIDRYRGTLKSARDIIRKIIRKRPEGVTLQIQHELVDEARDILDTAAGESVHEEQNRRDKAKVLAEKEERDNETRRAQEEWDDEMRRAQEKKDKRRRKRKRILKGAALVGGVMLLL